jgi:hypothetical protein
MTRTVPWLPLLAAACRGLRRLPLPPQAWNGGGRTSHRSALRLLGNSFVLFFSLLIASSGSRMSLAQSAVSIFGSAVPANAVEADYMAVTLGLKFYSTQPGTISGIRFYRGAKNSDGYVARLYSAGGTLLAQATLATDSCAVPCWEQANFASSVSIAANTTYVASYYTSSGRYPDGYYGLTKGASNGPLIAPASSAVGGNGVYYYGKGFPNQTWEDSNYYVDVSFTPSAPTPYLTLSFNPPNPSIASNTPAGSVVATIAATWSSGAPFTGTLSFGPPYSNDSATFVISGSQLIVNSTGPGLSADGGTTQNITVIATQ